MSRFVAIAVHDVAPATWDACARLLDVVHDCIGAAPLTLLVVPDYHHRGSVIADAFFRRAIDRRLSQGDELALHGYWHLDEGAPPRSARAWIERRVLTDREGEFATLEEAAARQRIAAGVEVLRQAGWTARGFVPPAWLLPPARLTPLAGFGFEYTTTRSELIRIGAGSVVRSRAVSLSSRTWVDRGLSRRTAPLLSRMLRPNPLLRLALHPCDARSPATLATWTQILRTALADREPVTKGAALRALAGERVRWDPAHPS